MKIFFTITLFSLLFSFCVHAQIQKVKLSLDPSSTVPAIYKEDAAKAFIIASAILSSTEFEDSIKNLDFPYRNYCRRCEPIHIYWGSKRINGNVILDSLYKRAEVAMELELDSGTCNGPLGQTCPRSENPEHLTTSFYYALGCDMPELPVSYRLAVNLCHEYMHFIGFCHPESIDKAPDKDHPAPVAYQKDIAYRVGWIAYYIAVKWQQDGKFK